MTPEEFAALQVGQYIFHETSPCGGPGYLGRVMERRAYGTVNGLIDIACVVRVSDGRPTFVEAACPLSVLTPAQVAVLVLAQ